MITLLGPTASGKTRLAAAVANRVEGEIISADSRQVYRGLDIGSGKDLDDYRVHGQAIPYHLIDIQDPRGEYNIYLFQKDFLAVYSDIRSRGKTPVLCGGSGMYLEAVLKGYNLPEIPDRQIRDKWADKSDEDLIEELKRYKKLHGNTDIVNRSRTLRALEIEISRRNHPVLKPFPAIPSVVFGLRMDREKQRQKITERLKTRMDQGMVREIEQLLSSGVTSERLKAFGLEYRYITMYLEGDLSYEEMFNLLNIAIHQFAKRQMTWFRKMEREGIAIHWLDGSLPVEQNVQLILSNLSEKNPY